ncbi:hypothetical protein FRC06_007894 [Ceratobasidium sp. 370]|nr:hypothetical protein FRC06_007894 [Ceratobasidium sp. 370]
MKKIDTILREAKCQAGVFFEGNLGIVTNGLLDIHRISTPLGKSFLTSEPGISSQALVRGQIQHSSYTGKSCYSCAPGVHAAADPGYDQALTHTTTYPIVGLDLVFSYLSGTRRVPYKEIEDAIANNNYSWIPKDCIPKGVPFKEPGYMTLNQTLAWLNRFEGWRIRSLRVFFTKVYMADCETKPSIDQASSRKVVTWNGVLVWLVQYTGLVTVLQNVKAVYYPSWSWDYFYYLQEGRNGSSDPTLGHDHWNGLPSRMDSDQPLQGQIRAEE